MVSPLTRNVPRFRLMSLRMYCTSMSSQQLVARKFLTDLEADHPVQVLLRRTRP